MVLDARDGAAALDPATVDTRVFSASVFMATILGTLGTAWWYQTIPHFPIFISWAGFYPPAFYILGLGLLVVGMLMFEYHDTHDVGLQRKIGLLGSFMLTLIGIVNGPAPAGLVLIHSIISVGCFVLYFIYIYRSGYRGSLFWIGIAAFLFGYVIAWFYVDWFQLLDRFSPAHWVARYKADLEQLPLFWRKGRAVCQWVMIACLFSIMFSGKADAVKHQQKKN